MWHIYGSSLVSLPELPPDSTNHLPSEDECKKILASAFTIKRIDSCYENDFRHLITPPPFNAEFLEKASKGVVNDKLRESVIKSMKEGFVSGYRGGSFFMRDFSKSMSKDDTTKAFEKMMKEVQKGFFLGPFSVCPFPNSWSENQAFICQLFFRPKHKFQTTDESD